MGAQQFLLTELRERVTFTVTSRVTKSGVLLRGRVRRVAGQRCAGPQQNSCWAVALGTFGTTIELQSYDHMH